ncbi:hypothetical protein ACIPW9_36265 [Streptomyces sp. NPDC090052]|uniref:hypothetical protein n=1 Tax=Streptomyces sp. NPDC090052 TaxID=3365931 RepID=UPI003816DA37
MTGTQGTHVHTADHASAPLSDDFAARLATLTGFLPGTQAGMGVEMVLNGLRIMATATKDRAQIATLLTLTAGEAHNQDDLVGLIADLVLHLTNPDTTPALNELPADTRDDVRARGKQWAGYDIGFAPRDLIAETAHAIQP